MNMNALTAEQFADSIGLTEEEAHSLIGEGMPTNPDGTLDLASCIAWQLKKNPLTDTQEGYTFRWKLSDAAEWLEYILTDGGKPAKAVIDEAKGLGLSRRTLSRAKERLGIVSKKAGSVWTWELPKRKSQSNIAK